MKKNLFKRMEFLSLMGMFVAGMMTFTACGSDDPDDPTPPPTVDPNGGGTGGSGGTGGTGGSTSNDPWANLVNEETKAFSVEGNKATYGDHTYIVGGPVYANGRNATARKAGTANGGWSAFDFNRYNEDAENYVTFTHVPSGYTEFKTIYEKFLGYYPEGCIAMLPMAMEIYGRNRATGEKCIQLLCTKTCANAALALLKEKIKSNTTDSYAQRYLPAALLDGANDRNAYKPNEPYRVNVHANPIQEHQEASLAGGTVMYNLVKTSGGWDTSNRLVSVIRLYDSESGPYKIFNFPDFYVQCKPIRGKWAGLK